MKKENLLGQKFGRLLVIDEAESTPSLNGAVWLCKCDCGNEKIIKAYNLKNNIVKSCGCLNTEKRKVRIKAMIKTNTKYNPNEATARAILRKQYNMLLDKNIDTQKLIEAGTRGYQKRYLIK